MPYSPAMPQPAALGFAGGAQPTPDMVQQRHDWRDALNAWRGQRPTPQSLFPNFAGGPPTADMRDQFNQARTDWQAAMPQMPASLAALMPQQMHGQMPGQMQQGFISGIAPNPLQNPPMSAPTI